MSIVRNFQLFEDKYLMIEKQDIEQKHLKNIRPSVISRLSFSWKTYNRYNDKIHLFPEGTYLLTTGRQSFNHIFTNCGLYFDM